MYTVEYLYQGKWQVALEIGSIMIAKSELIRLSQQYITRMQSPDGVYHFAT